MTHTIPTLADKPPHNNALDASISDAKALAGALNQLADHLTPEDADEIREPLFAVLDALRDKIAEVEKMVDAAPQG